MASAFGHGLVAGTIAHVILPKGQRNKTLVTIGIVCSILPDADVIAFRFGIPYGHMFGHRGFTHSIFFAVILALLINSLITNTNISKLRSFFFLFLCTVSHGLIDAMTTGGKGIALWSPISNERIFFPFRVIKVSPIRWQDFFSEWGITVLQSEAFWLGIPCILILMLSTLVKKGKIID